MWVWHMIDISFTFFLIKLKRTDSNTRITFFLICSFASCCIISLFFCEVYVNKWLRYKMIRVSSQLWTRHERWEADNKLKIIHRFQKEKKTSSFTITENSQPIRKEAQDLLLSDSRTRTCWQICTDSFYMYIFPWKNTGGEETLIFILNTVYL